MIRALRLIVLTIVFSSPACPALTTEGLVAHLTFAEDSGPTAADLTGNGHTASLIGTAWGTGHVSVPHDNQSAMVSIATGPQMQGQSFTWDLWFEAGINTLHGRVCAQTDAVGGNGAELIGLAGDQLGVRINNAGAVFDEPTIGTRSSSGPPDHWAIPLETFHRNAGPEHVVFTHDAGSRTVRIFIGLKGQPLKLSFEGTYTGSYAVSDVPLVIGNVPGSGRVFAEKVYQFSYYTRPLTHQVDGDRNVIGGEVHANHLAGDAATLLSTDLATSPSGHYITYKGEPLLLVGDSGTQVVMQNTNINHRQWIDDCAARGIRAVHVWAFVAPRQKQDGSRIEDRYGYVYPGITPWARKTSGADATDQLKQWDLQAFDEGPAGDSTHYWPRLRDLCDYADSKDMIVGITVFFGWPKHNTTARPDWSYHPLNVVNGGPVVDGGDPVTEAQMIDSPGTEVWSQPWSDAWPSRKKTQWIWERFSKKLIDETAPFGNVFFVFMDEHSYSEGNMGNHFRDFFRNRGQVWVDWNARRSTIDWVMSSTFGGDDKNANAVTGFTGSPARPYCFLEGEPYQGSGVRTAIWTFAMGGGNFFFHADERQETVTTGIMGYDPNVPGGDKGMYKRDWLGHASRFFNEYVTNLDTLVPHNELSSSGAYCLADPGREYLVYSKIGSSTTFSLNMSANAGVFDCRFYNPRDGQFQATFQRQGGGTESFTKPDSNDWTLHVVVSPDAPVAVIGTEPSPPEGFAPLTVDFDASGSYDNDDHGDPPSIVRYEWDFTDDGTDDESQASPTTSHAYPLAGAYTCRLRVTDNEGMTDETTVLITVKTVSGDFDGDRDVDQTDFGYFQACYSGSGEPANAGCEEAVLDGDGDVDQDDFAVFMACLSGAGIPADPNCAG